MASDSFAEAQGVRSYKPILGQMRAADRSEVHKHHRTGLQSSYQAARSNERDLPPGVTETADMDRQAGLRNIARSP